MLQITETQSPRPELARHRAVVFISNMNSAPWGGSEELWAETAIRLSGEGLSVAASVYGWSPIPHRISELSRAGVALHRRRTRHSVWARALSKIGEPRRTAATVEISRFLSANAGALVVISCTPYWIELMEECAKRAMPFATITQANSEHLWPDDEMAARLRAVMPAARRCFFVSNGNRRLLENQIGCDLANADVVWNPFNVPANVIVPWPHLDETSELRLASVARLHPPAKGQDILLEALSGLPWRARNWHLTLYGDGPMRDSIARMVQRFGLDGRVSFAGFVDSVPSIWATNHALVMPSRYEGMPLAMVEAMLCSRAVLATDIAGHAEIVEDGKTGFLADAPTVRSVGNALERLWANRAELGAIGLRAAKSIRARISQDPIEAFADRIKTLAQLP